MACIRINSSGYFLENVGKTKSRKDFNKAFIKATQQHANNAVKSGDKRGFRPDQIEAAESAETGKRQQGREQREEERLGNVSRKPCIAYLHSSAL